MRRHYIEHIEIESESNHTWQQSRRSWIKTMILGGLATQLPWLQSCATDMKTQPEDLVLDGQGIFKPSEMTSIQLFHYIIIPDDGNGPSATDVESANYMAWMLAQEFTSETDKTYFVDKWIKVSEKCIELHSCEIGDLDTNQQQEFMLTLTERGWTRTFVSKMTTVIFEAMLLDPIYGFNPNGIGWDWLDVTPGQPRANEKTKFPDFLTTIQSNYG